MIGLSREPLWKGRPTAAVGTGVVGPSQPDVLRRASPRLMLSVIVRHSSNNRSLTIHQL